MCSGIKTDKRWLISYVFIFLFILSIISGCSNNHKKNISVPLENNYFMLCCENTATSIDFNNSAFFDISYEIISAFPIDSIDDITVSFDKDTPFTLSIYEDSKYNCEIDNISAMTLQGFDWKQAAEDVNKCRNEEEIKNYLYNCGFFEDKIIENSQPLYSTILSINFLERNDSVELHELSITIRGVTKKYDIGVIKLNNNDSMDIDTTLFIHDIALKDIPIDAGHDGATGQIVLTAKVKNDLSLLNISASTETIQIQDVYFERILPNGESKNENWDFKDPLTLFRDENVSIVIDFRINDTKDSATATGQFFLMFNYLNSGKASMIPVEISYRERFDNPYYIYIEKELGKNILSYWTDYLVATDGASYYME